MIFILYIYKFHLDMLYLLVSVIICTETTGFDVTFIKVVKFVVDRATDALVHVVPFSSHAG